MTDTMQEVEKLSISKQAIRVQSVDVLRGIVMIIMAIDHVRVFSGILPGGPDAGAFFTRWITHFCAPTFTFLAGTSAFLYYQKKQSKEELVRFLISRGIVLVIMELTLVRFLWTFNFDYATFVHTNIIWTLGWSMIFLSLIVRFNFKVILSTGLFLIFGQKLLQFFPYLFPESIWESVANYWYFFYPTDLATKPTTSIIPGFALPEVSGISIAYVILPWLGVMMVGYCFGKLLTSNEEIVRKYTQRIGLLSIAAFLVFGSVVAYFSTQVAPFVFKLLGQHKYPPSELFLLMTLGPVIILVPWAERIKGRIVEALKIIGRVPMFYYLLHLLLIHLSAFIVNYILSGNIHHDWYTTSPLVGVAEGERWSLSLLYLVWAINLIPLYWACKQYAKYKADHLELHWLKYI